MEPVGIELECFNSELEHSNSELGGSTLIQKISSGRPKMPQDAQPERDVRPFCPQDGLKTPQERPKMDFWTIDREH